MVGSGLYMVGFGAGDQNHTVGILPDPYLLCSRIVEESLLLYLGEGKDCLEQILRQNRLFELEGTYNVHLVQLPFLADQS